MLKNANLAILALNLSIRYVLNLIAVQQVKLNIEMFAYLIALLETTTDKDFA